MPQNSTTAKHIIHLESYVCASIAVGYLLVEKWKKPGEDRNVQIFQIFRVGTYKKIKVLNIDVQ